MEYAVDFIYADGSKFDYYLGKVTEQYAIDWAERTKNASQFEKRKHSQILRYRVIASKV